MPSPAKVRELMAETRARRVAILAAGIALAGAVQAVELLIPLPLPWLRLGLGNAVTVWFLIARGNHAALAVTAGRLLVALPFAGLSFGWLLAVAGGISALAVMAALAAFGRGTFGPLGLSVAGALAHMGAQFWLVSAWWQAPVLLSQLPYALVFAYGAGLLTGWLAWRILQLRPLPD